MKYDLYGLMGGWVGRCKDIKAFLSIADISEKPSDFYSNATQSKNFQNFQIFLYNSF